MIQTMIQTTISRIALPLWVSVFVSVLASFLLSLCWRFARRAQAGRKRRMRLLEMELRLTDAAEAFHEEVFRLKNLRVVRPNLGLNTGLISSTKVSSLRYIKGRQK